MCYAIPGKVKQIEGKVVHVDYFGETKKALNEFESIAIGDYIYAQGGYVIDILDKDSAESILHVWKESFFELQEVDVKLSKMDLESKGLNRRLSIIFDKALDRRKLNYNDLLTLMSLETEEELTYLYKSANFLRQRYLSNSCCVHGIVEFSNSCTQCCHYCGISNFNKGLERYRMSIPEIISIAKHAVEGLGFKALVLQSAEDSENTVDRLVTIVSEIKKQCSVLIFISPGDVGVSTLEKLYQAGARGLLMRFESSNPELYHRYRPGKYLRDRLDQLQAAEKIGYLIVTGSIVGLPGQTNEDLVNDILLTKALNAEMYSFGPFVPHPETPLKASVSPNESTMLKVLSIARLVDPENAKILVTTAFESINTEAIKKGLLAGANSVMLNVSPDQYKKKYNLYPNRAHDDENIQSHIESTIAKLRSLGRAPTDLGTS